MKLTRKEFEEIVILALKGLPKLIRNRMENVEIVIEDRAKRGLLA
ncbi:MAG: hypothetical protein ACPL6D_12570, partial [Thermodesulfobacteriota bacterium]